MIYCSNEIGIDNCNDCPFKTFGGWEGEKSLCSIDDKKRVLNPEEFFGKIKKIPDWCKLKKGEITVKFL